MIRGYAFMNIEDAMRYFYLITLLVLHNAER